MSAQTLPPPHRHAIVATISAYADADRVTFGDTIPKEGRTCAAPRWVPIGTEVEITVPGRGRFVRTVEDRTANRVGVEGRWDLFKLPRSACIQWGIPTGTVRILRWGPANSPAKGKKITAGGYLRPRPGVVNSRNNQQKTK